MMSYYMSSGRRVQRAVATYRTIFGSIDFIVKLVQIAGSFVTLKVPILADRLESNKTL